MGWVGEVLQGDGTLGWVGEPRDGRCGMGWPSSVYEHTWLQQHSSQRPIHAHLWKGGAPGRPPASSTPNLHRWTPFFCNKFTYWKIFDATQYSDLENWYSIVLKCNIISLVRKGRECVQPGKDWEEILLMLIKIWRAPSDLSNKWARLISTVPSDRTTGNGHKLEHLNSMRTWGKNSLL